MLVIISNNESEPNTIGERKSSTVYHFHPSHRGWQCGTALSIKEPVEVEEDLAKAFGRTLCGSCTLTKERVTALATIKHKVNDTLDTTLEQISAKLPDNIEIRIYAHGLNNRKTPTMIWSSLTDKD